MKVVLDTNIFVSALKSNKGASFAIISQLPSDKFQIALTIPLYLEYQDVLTRPEHMSGASTKEEILAFLRYICSIAHRQQVFFLWRPWINDPKDDMVLESAVASQSRYIVTVFFRGKVRDNHPINTADSTLFKKPLYSHMKYRVQVSHQNKGYIYPGTNIC